MIDSPFSRLDKSNASWQLTARVQNWIQSDFRLPPKALQYWPLVNQVYPQFYVSRGRPDEKVTCDQMRKHNARLFNIYTTELVNSFTPVLTYEQPCRPNSQTWMECCHACAALFFRVFRNTTAYHLGWFSLHILLLKSSMAQLINPPPHGYHNAFIKACFLIHLKKAKYQMWKTFITSDEKLRPEKVTKEKYLRRFKKSGREKNSWKRSLKSCWTLFCFQTKNEKNHFPFILFMIIFQSLTLSIRLF